MLVIGESLNATIPAVRSAIEARDEKTIAALAREQVDCGADMLDVNAGGLGGRDECADLVWMVEVVQEAAQVPLVLDSSNPEALLAALEVYKGPRPLLSSVTGESVRLEPLLPVALKHHCGLVALCMDERGIPADVESRVAIAEFLISRLTSAGIRAGDIYVDPLVMSISADYTAAVTVMRVIGRIKELFPQVNIICAPSNVSFGVPVRRLLNRTFVSMLVAVGADALIVNVRDREMTATLRAATVLAGSDKWCRAYLKAYREGKLEK